jgi:3-methylfumaryl-CoA hydratase
MKPLFDVAPFFVCGRRQDAQTVKLWARNAEGQLAMDASATLA